MSLEPQFYIRHIPTQNSSLVYDLKQVEQTISSNVKNVIDDKCLKETLKIIDEKPRVQLGTPFFITDYKNILEPKNKIDEFLSQTLSIIDVNHDEATNESFKYKQEVIYGKATIQQVQKPNDSNESTPTQNSNNRNNSTDEWFEEVFGNSPLFSTFSVNSSLKEEHPRVESNASQKTNKIQQVQKPNDSNEKMPSQDSSSQIEPNNRNNSTDEWFEEVFGNSPLFSTFNVHSSPKEKHPRVESKSSQKANKNISKLTCIHPNINLNINIIPEGKPNKRVLEENLLYDNDDKSNVNDQNKQSSLNASHNTTTSTYAYRPFRVRPNIDVNFNSNTPRSPTQKADFLGTPKLQQPPMRQALFDSSSISNQSTPINAQGSPGRTPYPMNMRSDSSSLDNCSSSYSSHLFEETIKMQDYSKNHSSVPNSTNNVHGKQNLNRSAFANTNPLLPNVSSSLNQISESNVDSSSNQNVSTESKLLRNNKKQSLELCINLIPDEKLTRLLTGSSSINDSGSGLASKRGLSDDFKIQKRLKFNFDGNADNTNNFTVVPID